MGFFFRKAINLGPVRLNLSKSGVGVSVGAKGVRIGKTARGKSYVRVGSNGVYYQKYFGEKLAGKGK